MPITYIEHASNPADSGSATGAGDTAKAVTFSSAAAGDLVILAGLYRWSIPPVMSETGGQSWTVSPTVFNNCHLVVAWCVFNGTWSASPSMIAPGGSSGIGMSVRGAVFRPPSGMTWLTDARFVLATTTGSPQTAPSMTLDGTDNLSLALFASTDANTFGSLTGGWTHAGGVAQVRNTTGSGSSLAMAHKIGTAAGTSGSVSVTQATLGPDIGVYGTIAFKAVTAPSFPLSLFGGARRGAIYDPSDASRRFVTSALATAAVADDLVGGLTDPASKLDMLQATSGNRPTLKTSDGAWWLQASNTTDSMTSATQDRFYGPDEFEIAAAIRPTTISTTGANEWNNAPFVTDGGTWVDLYSKTSGGLFYLGIYGGNDKFVTVQVAQATDYTVFARLVGGQLGISLDGATWAEVASGPTPVLTQAQTLFAVSHAATGLNNRIYAAVIRGKAFTSGERAAAKAWLESKLPGYVAPVNYSIEITPSNIGYQGQEIDYTWVSNFDPGNISYAGQSINLILSEARSIEIVPSNITYQGQSINLTLFTPLSGTAGRWSKPYRHWLRMHGRRG